MLDVLFADMSENGTDFHVPELIAFIWETLNPLCEKLAEWKDWVIERPNFGRNTRLYFTIQK